MVDKVVKEEDVEEAIAKRSVKRIPLPAGDVVEVVSREYRGTIDRIEVRRYNTNTPQGRGGSQQGA